MRKLFQLLICIILSGSIFAQETPSSDKKKKKDWSKVKLTGRSNDHFMIQYGYTNWSNKPDSLNTNGFPRSFNVYVMLDIPFKTDPRFSVAFGPGIGTDHIMFEKTNITIANHLTPLQFQNVSDTNHFEKYKLTTAYIELPLELRFVLNPENSNKSFKVAIGAKGGMLVDAHTKGKKWVTKNGATVAGFSDIYIRKDKDRFFFNSNRIVGTFRAGYGNFTAYTTYQFASLFKNELGPSVKPWSVGLTISGL